MKTIHYKYDEGYGYGDMDTEETGMTINEVIQSLQAYANKGLGESLLFDSMRYPIDGISFRTDERITEGIVIME